MATPTIRIHEFKTEFEQDKNTGEYNRTVDYVCYSPIHAIMTSRTWERVEHMRPPERLARDPGGKKMMEMRILWDMIEPQYMAWKNGQEIPIDGTPLSAWPGINAAHAQVLQRHGLRTVEEVAAMGDGVLDKLPLPDKRKLREQAQAFLSAKESGQAAKRMTELEAETAALKAQLSEALEMLKDQKPKRGRPAKVEQETEAA